MIYKLKGTLTSTVFILLFLLILSALVIYPLWTMLFLGAIFAYTVRPLALKINQRIPYLSVCIIIAMVLVIMPLVGLIIFTADALIHSAPSLISIASGSDLNSVTPLIYRNIPSQFQPSADSVVGLVKGLLNDLIRASVSYVIELIQSIPMLALQIFIFFSATFYFARDGHKLLSYIASTVPDKRKPFIKRMSMETERVLKSIFYGHFLTAIIIGLIAAAGFYILGYPYALLLGLLTGFFQLIPVIGPWAAYTPLAIYDFITGNILRGGLVLVLGFILSTSDIYIRPKLSGKYADIHPMIFLVGFFGGPLIWGIAGFIIGPLILGLAYAAVEAYRAETGK